MSPKRTLAVASRSCPANDSAPRRPPAAGLGIVGSKADSVRFVSVRGMKISIPQTQVQRQPRSDFEVVLAHSGAVTVNVIHALGVEIAARVVRTAQQKAGEGVAGVASGLRIGGLQAVEVEHALRVRIVEGILEGAPAPIFKPELEFMAALHPGHTIDEVVGPVLLRAAILRIVPETASSRP